MITGPAAAGRGHLPVHITVRLLQPSILVGQPALPDAAGRLPQHVSQRSVPVGHAHEVHCFLGAGCLASGPEGLHIAKERNLMSCGSCPSLAVADTGGCMPASPHRSPAS